MSLSSLITLLLFAFILICLPCILLGRLTESKRQTIRRLSRQGLSQRAIADRLQITRYRVRLALA